jgi:hypothetical protein
LFWHFVFFGRIVARHRIGERERQGVAIVGRGNTGGRAII